MANINALFVISVTLILSLKYHPGFLLFFQHSKCDIDRNASKKCMVQCNHIYRGMKDDFHHCLALLEVEWTKDKLRSLCVSLLLDNLVRAMSGA